ncbi:M23 family metallopeptidase [Paraglaciecola sp. MB-3u-78]|uniref:M23 family metallopeptidase n=1 Tax=Paraglaciecola sp. MB-3u-78 TaxID=2058332 RepID=UPI000C337CF5|nr:M23 family metallopeptidase [Paraglaciecola sp. MB-3u-78]PKG93358.1 peptidase M23 [Paraglaciecola sp. MB-3u-78]
MLKQLDKITQVYFPHRQLLIRQNGEVKYLPISTSIQLVLSLILLTIFSWFSYSTIKYFSLNAKVSQTKDNLKQSQTDFNALSAQYQTKNTQLNQQLSQLQQQQIILQNLLDSLPEKIAPINTSDASKPLNNSNDNTQTTDNSVLKNLIQVKNRLDSLETVQKNSFDKMSLQISKRKQQLIQAFYLTGISIDMIHHQPIYAQGGPLFELSENTTDKYHHLTNELIELRQLETSLKNVPIKLPAKNYYISSTYGYRKDPFVNKKAMHKGIDMAGWIKTEIYAPADGKVIRAGKNGSYGNFIEIDHLNGFTTRYGHLYKVKVKKDEYVSEDFVIGLMGSTGRSTSTHLHYEVLFDDKTINPLKLTKALKHVL